MTDPRKNNISKQLQDIGKMPPQSIDAEESVLGAAMLETQCVNLLSDILKPKSFYKESHELIFESILRLSKSNQPVDIVTVTQDLKKAGKLDIVGGAYYISQLTSKVGSSANSEFHARIIQQKFIQREIIRISSEAIREAYKETSDCFDILDSIEGELTAINRDFEIGKVQHISTLWEEAKTHNEALLTKKGITGVPSSYDNIDKLTGGWQPSDLIIIAARPAMGKTSLAVNFARNASVEFNIPGVIFSLEMASRQLATRILSLESRVKITEFMRRGIMPDQMILVESDCKRLIDSPLYFDDTPAITLNELRSKSRKLKREKNIGYIVVDYLQLMSGEKTGNRSGNREQEISSISRGLKSLAKELNVPVIALSQLSREPEKRIDKRPQLSDLRESGAIEQDADIVVFIHRPEYYGIMEYEGGIPTNGIAEIIFAKHRNGSTGTEKLRFIDRLTKFENLEPKLSAMEPVHDFTTSNKTEDLPF